MAAPRRPPWPVTPAPQSQFAQLVFAGVVLIVLLFLTAPLQYLPLCVLAAIVFTIAVGMIDVTSLRDIRRESPGEFYLAVATAAAVVAIGVEQGILLAIALSLFRHVRQSYRPNTAILVPDVAGRWMPPLQAARAHQDLRHGRCRTALDHAGTGADAAVRPVRALAPSNSVLAVSCWLAYTGFVVARTRAACFPSGVVCGSSV